MVFIMWVLGWDFWVGLGLRHRLLWFWVLHMGLSVSFGLRHRLLRFGC